MNILNIFRRSEPAPTVPSKRAITYQIGEAAGLVEPASRAGVHVSEKSALGISAVYRAARVISESVGTMPLKLYQHTGEGRDEARDNPLWTLFHDEPNPEQSAIDFFSLMQWWAVLWGNAHAEIERDGSGRPLALWPIPPGGAHFDRSPSGEPVYVLNGEGGYIPASDVIHIKGPTCDGGEGYRLVHLARESLGYSIALERFGASYFGNSCKVGGVLKVAGQLSDPARENIRKSWAALYSGVDNVGKVPLLEEGLEFTPFAVNNEQGQYVESRTYQLYEVCRWFGVDPIFLYEYGRATWSNAEAQTRNFLQFSLNPWLRKWESELSRKAISKADRAKIYPEFVRESIIQMDTKTQAEVWKIGKDGGWLEVNEIRKWQNLPPIKEPDPVPVVVPSNDPVSEVPADVAA